ncbi:hypothetical protein CC86DRAFT_303992 [Ophiobolus disseminans]|uniref:Tat pathway signal sequence n=1 Tax=Ophiobolus disseminans TaxID=1469910 RepID=A0A6A6ZKF6_9PLEO|nr:hypothetical protein CC86DRAFT_303992 [Ophiobolus disseminans]
MFDYMDIETSITKMNGTFLMPPDPAWSRQMPGPEADEVWDEILIDRFIPVTREQIIKLGKDPKTAVQLRDSDWHLGDNAYMAGLDIFHQLHCVDLLRRTAYSAYYNETPPLRTERPRIAEYHVNHCVDLIVQQLTCSANYHMFTMHWVKKERYPSPDFSVHRKCPNFQNLWDWRQRNTLDPHRIKEVFGSGVKPDGVVQVENLAALDY